MFLIFFAGLDWGWRKEPYMRLDGPQETIKDALINGLDLCTNPTGLGWTHGLKRRNSKSKSNANSDAQPPKEQSRALFVATHIGWSVAWLLIMDILKFIIDTLEPNLILTPPSSIYDPTFPLPLRALKSTLLTTLFGILTVGGLEFLINLTKIISVGIFTVPPRRCPKLFNRPWFYTSLGRFWAEGWHQHARYYFLMFGGRPLARLVTGAKGKGRARRSALVLGTFILSGIIHDLCTMSLGKGPDPSKITTFFTMMGVGIVLEETYTAFFGRKVEGPAGWIWTMSWLLGWGGLLVDAWCQRGMAANRPIFPEDKRPSTIFWEFLSPLLHLN